MKKQLVMMLILFPMIATLTGCKSDEDKVRETAEAYLYKIMKNPESLKIISCEVRKDTIPFWLSEEMFDMAKETQEAINKFNRYKDMSYLFAEEKYESTKKAMESSNALKEAYKSSQQNDSIDVEYIAYVKSSGTNPMGGTVSSSSIIIIDKNDPTKILGTYLVDSDFIEQFVTLKVLGEEYEFKKNKFGKYQTEGLPYFEQFVMNDAE
nr:hypothetical protein [Bacteroides acidifaciens]